MTGFFEHQDRARRNTRWLLVLMALGVVGMGAALFAVLSLGEPLILAQQNRIAGRPLHFDGLLLVGCVAGTALIVALASGVRLAQLRGGGRQVAEMLGGRLVSGAPRDALERRLLNVVEEMAIASGVPVPEVFVLDGEAGINALAAGLGFEDAAIAVTRGCLETLSRDELQGVIAHEFSHVLNGDMRLNMQLMGVVFGIVCIGLLGRILMRSMEAKGRSNRNSAAGIAAAGLCVYLIGLVGELCGKLIKAAVSRQREFLADASAVQFTRNPAGIAGALKKIGGYASGSRVATARAEEASHFFFGEIHRSLVGASPFATHPSLALRIRRLDPSFDGTFAPVRSAGSAPGSEAVAGLAELGEAVGFAGRRDAPAGAVRPRSRPGAEWVREQVGTTSAQALADSRALLDGLPDELVQAAQSPFAASAAVYALLLSSESGVQAMQRERLDALAGRALRDEALRLLPALRALPARSRLPLAELCAPALRQLSQTQRQAFTRSIDALIEADRELSTFEYVLAQSLRRRLDAERPRERAVVRRARLPALQVQAQLLLSLLAHAGAHEPGAAERAFAAGATRLLQRQGLRLSFGAAPRLEGLGRALGELAGLVPEDAALLVEACAHTVLEDRRVDDDEVSLLRVICEALGCPLPLPVVQAG
jgi:Zn-dependent protease with chaperone function